MVSSRLGLPRALFSLRPLAHTFPLLSRNIPYSEMSAKFITIAMLAAAVSVQALPQDGVNARKSILHMVLRTAHTVVPHSSSPGRLQFCCSRAHVFLFVRR